MVPAAGIGERARTNESDPPKQFVTLGGRPMFMWAVDALLMAGCDPVVLVVPPVMIDTAQALTEMPGAIQFTGGGATRQESVSHGLERVTTDAVVVHDAARPFVTGDLVRDVMAALEDADAVVAAVPMDETLKRATVGDAPVTVKGTVDRSDLWRAQTPAAFRTEVLRDAHSRARAEGFVGTDESSLVERYGGVVRVVLGTRSNLKVTFPEDFAVAEAMMATRK
ncbi:MAG: 2-C-methyl-D-erythritol 4-phosphate cytidylyltransferase [Actinomycetota bacterium]